MLGKRSAPWKEDFRIVDAARRLDSRLAYHSALMQGSVIVVTCSAVQNSEIACRRSSRAVRRADDGQQHVDMGEYIRQLGRGKPLLRCRKRDSAHTAMASPLSIWRVIPD